MYVIYSTCLNEFFLSNLITGRRYYLLKVYFYSAVYSIAKLLLSLKEVRILCHLHKNSTMLIPKLYYTFLNFSKKLILFYGYVF